MATALLLFPHQLFESNRRLAAGKRVYLVEDPLFFDQYAFHRQKLVLHRATMRMHATYLRRAGVAVDYIESHAAPEMESVIGRIASDGITALHLIDPTDDWL